LVNAARPQNIVALDQSLEICRMEAKVPRKAFHGSVINISIILYMAKRSDL